MLYRGPLPSVERRSNLAVLYLRGSGLEHPVLDGTGDRLPNFLIFDWQGTCKVLQWACSDLAMGMQYSCF